jgi:hypothetical protein
MKKLSILGIAAMALSLASCKKAYKCECTTNFDADDKMVVTRDIAKTSKKTAEAICGNYSTTETYSTYSPVGTESETALTTCELK